MADVSSLCQAFERKEATIGIIGLGYVGLPLMVAAASQGIKTIGYDLDKEKIEKINRGESYIGNIHSAVITPLVQKGLIFATATESDLQRADAILMCVPTPLNKNREPDLSYIVSTAESIVPYLRAGQLIVLESTTYPGTMSDVVRPILEKSGLIAGQDFYLAYSPEREDPGNATFHTAMIPKVVGGDSEDALKLALALYDQFVTKTIPVSSTRTAEAVKLTENIFRSVNIALVNELKVIFDAMGIDIWEVIEAAKSKPFGYMPFYPGPGLGGHCIPIDPFYLSWKAREYNIPARFIELAGEINVAMPRYVVERLAQALDLRFAKPLNGATILLLGLAYKKNVADIRESPSFSIMDQLVQRKAKVIYHDPYVPEIPVTREHPGFSGQQSVDLTQKVLSEADAVVIVTDHDNVDYEFVQKHAMLVIDTRNAMEKVASDKKNVVKA